MGLREVLDRAFADFEGRELPRPTRRDAPLALLPGKIDAVAGPRRCGKTWFFYQCIRDLEERGTPRNRILYLNFEDERLLPMTTDDLAEVTEAFYRRHPDARREPCWFFFDEIQNVPGWERFLRRLLDTENARIAVTGSSAKLLGPEIATALRGRSLRTDLYPFSFAEALRHANTPIATRWPPAAPERSLLDNRFSAYMATGGFPEVQTLDVETRARVLQEYLDAVLFRDVIERHQVKDAAVLRALLRRLVADPATPFSVHAFHRTLRQEGYRVSKDSLHEYTAHLEDAMLLIAVPIGGRSEKARLVNPRKTYIVDHAYSPACNYSPHRDPGHLLENAVAVELHRRGYGLRYLRTASGAEVDFLAERPPSPPVLLQVCADLSAPATRERECRALSEAMAETGLPAAAIVTLHEEETIRIGRRTVRVLPAWRWFLEKETGASRGPQPDG